MQCATRHAVPLHILPPAMGSLLPSLLGLRLQERQQVPRTLGWALIMRDL